MSIIADIVVKGRGQVLVDDKWTDDAIEADPTGFDEAILEALPLNLDTIEFEIDDAWTRRPEGV